MVYFSIAVLLLVSTVIVTIIVRDTVQSRVELFSTRNVFLFGILLFQTVSAVFSLSADDYGQVFIQSPALTSLGFCLCLVLFLVFFFGAYNKAPVIAKFAQRVTTTHDASDAGILVCAFFAILIGLLFRFVLGPIPILGNLTMQLASGAFAVSCGLAGWAWGRRPANFVIFISAVGVVLVCVAALLTFTFGRREVMGVMFAFVWGLYYTRWRLSSPTLLVFRATVFGSIGLVFLMFFTASRQGDESNRTAADYLVAFTRVSADEIVESAFALGSGQQAASNSMWLMETHPSEFSYDTLHSLAYFAMHPVPRTIYENKLNPLGQSMVHDAGITKVADEYSVGPGLIGHVFNDNPWIALPLYAVLLGLALRYIDTRVQSAITDPFVVVPLGAGLSQLLAIPRGELGLFAFQMMTAIVGGWLALRMIAPLLWWRVEPDTEDDECEFDHTEYDNDAPPDQNGDARDVLMRGN